MSDIYQTNSGKRSKGEPVKIIEIVSNNSFRRIRRAIGDAGTKSDKKYIAVIYEEEGIQYDEKQ